MPNKILLFILLLLLNPYFSSASIEPYCKNAISQDLLHQIDNSPPKVIEIEIHKNRKWIRNDFKIARNVSVD